MVSSTPPPAFLVVHGVRAAPRAYPQECLMCPTVSGVTVLGCYWGTGTTAWEALDRASQVALRSRHFPKDPEWVMCLFSPGGDIVCGWDIGRRFTERDPLVWFATVAVCQDPFEEEEEPEEVR